MAEQKFDEYKFPDEVKEEPIEIEVFDDMPEEDKKNAAPLPKEIVEDIDGDDLTAYSGEAKARLLQIKKAMHDERRLKESAQREQEEAITFAKRILGENQQLKAKLFNGEKSLVSSVKENASRQLDEAKRAYKEAYDSGDSEKLVDAQEKLTDAKIKEQEIERYQPEYSEETLQNEQNYAKMPQQPQKLEPKTQSWLDKNSWYGVDDDMSYLAMGIHRRLEREGVSVGSEHYFNVIDKEIRQRFPEKFDIEEQKSSEEPEVKASAKKLANVVAPATRSTSPKKVRLTTSQVNLAKKFNITPEQYARELQKLESQND